MRPLLACVLLVLAWSLDALAQDGPPPPQAFGPDTVRTGVFTGGPPTPLTCDGAAGQARTCSAFLASAVDGTLLDVTVAVPAGDGLHPLVVVLHGWGGSKGSNGWLAVPLLADGHAVLRYSARGFGESWGQVNLADVNVELEDLRSIVGQLVEDPQLQLDHEKIGVTGVSYGGGQTWLALVKPSFPSARGEKTVRISAVAPIVPWTDLVYSLLPNGRPEFSLLPPGSPKLSYINGLFLSGLRFTPQRPYINYPDYLILWDTWLNLVEPNRFDPVYRQIFDGIAGYRSIWWQQDFWRDAAANRVPVFQVQGLTDDLFPLTEAKRMLLALKSRASDYPIASYFGDLGHPRAANKEAERDYVVDLIRKWFSYYLRNMGTQPEHVVRAAITRPRNQPFAPEDVITVNTYGELATAIAEKRFGGTATLVNPVGDPYRGFFWDPLVMEGSRELQPLPAPPEPALVARASAVYTVPVAELSGASPLLIAGQPTVSLRAATTGLRVQLNVRLVDVAPDGAQQLITRGTFILQSAPAGADVVIPTYGNVWEAAPEHVLRLEITTLDTPYLAPSRVPSVTRISQVRLELPKR
jgi:ABC-2 type transport system ATP-binding protein